MDSPPNESWPLLNDGDGGLLRDCNFFAASNFHLDPMIWLQASFQLFADRDFAINYDKSFAKQFGHRLHSLDMLRHDAHHHDDRNA
jgi:hypothetical protein